MNERIKELKEQAFNFVAEQNMTKKEYFWENIRHNRTLQDRVDKKFAELLIRECALQCVHNEDMDLIEKHFGIKE